MKGLFYEYFSRYKVWHITAVSVWAAIIVLGGVLFAFLGHDPTFTPIFSLLCIVSPAIPCVTLVETTSRDTERHIKGKFMNYILSGPFTYRSYANYRLIHIIMLTVLSATLMFSMYGFFALFGYSDIDSYMKIGLCLLILFSGMNYWIDYATLCMKSSEKGGLVVGLVLGFGVMGPFYTVSMFMEMEGMTDIFSFLGTVPGLLTLAGVYLVSTALCRVLYELRLRKGDIC